MSLPERIAVTLVLGGLVVVELVTGHDLWAIFLAPVFGWSAAVLTFGLLRLRRARRAYLAVLTGEGRTPRVRVVVRVTWRQGTDATEVLATARTFADATIQRLDDNFEEYDRGQG